MVKGDNYYKLLGDEIRRCREKAGLTQADLAEAAGFSRTSITNIERGHQRVFVDQLDLISQAIGVSPVDFFSKRRRPAKPATAAENHLIAMPMVSEFLKNIRKDEELE